MSMRFTTTVGMRVGDVLQVAVELTDKKTGAPFWWRRFTVVVGITSERFATLLTLKMHPDMDKDLREVDFSKDVVMLVPSDMWPQGVVAMRMKAIHMGWIKPGDED